MEQTTNSLVDLTAFEIGVQYLNHRIKAKVFKLESLDSLINRLIFILGVEKEFILGLYPKQLLLDEPDSDYQSVRTGGLAGLSQDGRKKSLQGKMTQNSALLAKDMIIISTKQTKITRPETMKFRCEDDEGEEESKEHTSKKKRDKKTFSAIQDSSNEEDYDDEDDDEEEEGQIVIPKGIIMDDINEIKAGENYMLIYIRHKSDEEIKIEKEILAHEINVLREEEGERSNRMSPRRFQMKKFENQGIKIKESYYKIKKDKLELQREEGSFKLRCPFVNCLKKFSETGNIKTHLRTHTGDRPFFCPHQGCVKQFITKGHLKTHELIHSGDKPFQCSVCKKMYSRKNRLNIHMRTHTGEKPFECPYAGCNKLFTERGNLKTHLRIHSGEKPFICSVPGCVKTFTTQGHLTDHMRRHSGDRPFKCHICNNSFMRSSTLKIHIRRHTGERPYDCHYCGKKFSESGNMKTHLKTHETGRLSKKKTLNISIKGSQVRSPLITPGAPSHQIQQKMTFSDLVSQNINPPVFNGRVRLPNIQSLKPNQPSIMQKKTLSPRIKGRNTQPKNNSIIQSQPAIDNKKSMLHQEKRSGAPTPPPSQISQEQNFKKPETSILGKRIKTQATQNSRIPISTPKIGFKREALGEENKEQSEIQNINFSETTNEVGYQLREQESEVPISPSTMSKRIKLKDPFEGKFTIKAIQTQIYSSPENATQIREHQSYLSDNQTPTDIPPLNIEFQMLNNQDMNFSSMVVQESSKQMAAQQIDQQINQAPQQQTTQQDIVYQQTSAQITHQLPLQTAQIINPHQQISQPIAFTLQSNLVGTQQSTDFQTFTIAAQSNKQQQQFGMQQQQQQQQQQQPATFQTFTQVFNTPNVYQFTNKPPPMPAKQASFQNLFASMQHNNPMGHYPYLQQANNGIQANDQLQGNLTYLGQPQKQFMQNAAGQQNNSAQKQQIHHQNPLVKWKALNIGSFSSVNSLSDLIKTQTGGFSYPQNQFQYPSAAISRPISKQNSANNLYGLAQMNKKLEQYNQAQPLGSQGTSVGSNTAYQQVKNNDMGAPVTASILDPSEIQNTFMKLQKSQSLKNVFNQPPKLLPSAQIINSNTSQQSSQLNFQQQRGGNQNNNIGAGNTISVNSGSSALTFHKPQEQKIETLSQTLVTQPQQQLATTIFVAQQPLQTAQIVQLHAQQQHPAMLQINNQQNPPKNNGEQENFSSLVARYQQNGGNQLE